MSSYKDYTTVVANDYGYDLEGAIVDSDDKVVDLSDCTLKIIISEPEATRPKIETTATVTSPATSGLWSFTVRPGDFDVGDKTYDVEIEIHRTTPEAVLTAYGGTIYVKSEAPEMEYELQDRLISLEVEAI